MNKVFCQPALAIGAALLVAACADTGTAVIDKEDMLASAGFVAKKLTVRHG